MLAINDLRTLAAVRLEDAETLHAYGRYDGAAYLCGYAAELALKARICSTLGWAGFPATNAEFKNYQSFKTHDLDVLLSLSGVEATIKANHMTDWSGVADWDPESRYWPSGSTSSQAATYMLSSVRSLLKAI